VITGDVNCNLLASDADVCKRKFSEFLNGLCLHQFVNQPTHRSGSLLDVLVSNSASFVSNVNVAQCPYSDHCIISADLCIPKNRPKSTFISSRRLHRMNVLGFQDTLRVTDWSAVFSCTDVSGQCTVGDWTHLARHVLIGSPRSYLMRYRIENWHGGQGVFFLQTVKIAS